MESKLIKTTLKNQKTLNMEFLSNSKELQSKTNLKMRKRLLEFLSAKRNFHQKMECLQTLKSLREIQSR